MEPAEDRGANHIRRGGVGMKLLSIGVALSRARCWVVTGLFEKDCIRVVKILKSCNLGIRNIEMYRMCLASFEVGFEGVTMAVWKLKLRSGPTLVRGKDVTVTHPLFALFFDVSTLIGMLPSQKRKRKLHPKRPCPCCGATLSEKTIERHASGNHILTHIKVTHAQKRARFSENLSSTLLGDLSGKDDLESLDSDLESTHSDAGSDADLEELEETIRYTWSDRVEDYDESDTEDVDTTVNEPGAPRVNITQDTWSGRRARVDDYVDSDTEDEDDQPRRTDTSDEDFDFDFEEEMGTCNGLGMDDLIDEDFQRIIAEFGASNFLSCVTTTYSDNTTIQLKNCQKRILISCVHFH